MRRTCPEHLADCHWLLVVVRLSGLLRIYHVQLMALSVILNQMKNATQSHTRSDWSVLFLSMLNLNWSHNSNPMHWPRSLCSLTEVDIQTHRFDCGNPWCTDGREMGETLILFAAGALWAMFTSTCVHLWAKMAMTSQSRLGRTVNWDYEPTASIPVTQYDMVGSI